MNFLCIDCGRSIDYLDLILDGEKLFGLTNENDQLQCLDCYLIKNPIGSEPEWCKDLERWGCLDFMN